MKKEVSRVMSNGINMNTMPNDTRLKELELFCDQIIERIQKRFKHPKTEEEYEKMTKGQMHEAGKLYMAHHILAEITRQLYSKKVATNQHK